MDIRAVTKAEHGQVNDLREYSFNNHYSGKKLDDFLYWVEQANTIGAFIDGKLVGQTMIFPLNMTIRQQNMAMGGIGFVATYPEYRNRGIMKKIMMTALQEMRKNKQNISVLAPFSVSFYRHFGWELFNDVLHFEVPLQHFPRFGKQLDDMRRTTFKTVDEQLFEQIKNFHNRLAKERTGMLVRDAAWWNRLIARQPNGSVAAVFEQDIISGYMRYEIIGLDFVITDYYAIHFAAEQALWRFITAHEASVQTIKGMKNAYDSFAIPFQEPQIKQKIKQHAMIRIVDVEAFFNNFKFQQDEVDFYVQVEDQFAPWNNATFHITANETKKVTESTIACEQLLKIPINWFSALVAGYLTVEQIRYFNIISISDQLAEKINRIFTPEKVFFNEYF